MEIESMVANSALIRAREGGEGKGRSLNWQKMLCFPHVSQCTDLAMTIERDYQSLCVQQPIGKLLFQLFCRSTPELQNCVCFQNALEIFETKLDQERRDFGISIVQKYLWSRSIMCVEVLRRHENTCIQSLAQQPSSDVFHDCRKDLHEHLSGTPFLQYQESMFFDRFLQWKMLERQPITKRTFRHYRQLGKGGFGEVWACQVRATGKMYACKKLHKTYVKTRRGESMALNEKQILEKVNSRFVVSLAYAYETKQSLCLVLTIMNGGDLRFHIYDLGFPGLDKDRVQFYAAEVCCGLNHLHQQGIVYRDLKPENILVDDNGHIRISDLGLAVRLKGGSLVKGRVGTMGYMAPEVVAHDYYGTSPDWWGLGCLIYEMTAGQPPFRERGEHPKAEEMSRRILKEEETYTQRFDSDTKDLCRSLLKKDPKQRQGCQAAGAAAVQSHPFFNNINFRMLDAGLVEPPFKPDPRLVYCSDVQDIDEFATIRGVNLDDTDTDFYSKFNTGSVSITWQNEIIDTGCFQNLNVFGPDGSRSPDLDWSQVPVPRKPKRCRVFRFFHRRSKHHPDDETKPVLLTSEKPGLF